MKSGPLKTTQRCTWIYPQPLFMKRMWCKFHTFLPMRKSKHYWDQCMPIILTGYCERVSDYNIHTSYTSTTFFAIIGRTSTMPDQKSFCIESVMYALACTWQTPSKTKDLWQKAVPICHGWVGFLTALYRQMSTQLIPSQPLLAHVKRKYTLRSLSLSYQKKDGMTPTF